LAKGKGFTVWSLLAQLAYKGKDRGDLQAKQLARFQPVRNSDTKRKEVAMLRWALGFFVVALVAAVLGFSGIAVASAGIAKILFFIFLVLFLASLVGHLTRRT
jgi:uncharacterized membrane protein YtjA (UPF0391 family)